MAIFVSNPTSSAITTLSPDALDPSVISPEEGFTEELAAAMQPSAAPTDALAKTPLDMPEEAVKKASDLQILPAEVLLNAVGDANFAFAGQTETANSAAKNSVPGAALTDATETLEQDNTVLDLTNPLQGAELAAANLAAQMSASVANVPVALASNSTEVSAVLSINATAGVGQAAAQASQAPVAGPGLQEGEQVASATHLAAQYNTPALSAESIKPATEKQTASMAPVATAQAALKSVQSDATGNVSQVNATPTANAVSAVDGPVQQAVAGVVSNNIQPDGVQAEAVVQQAAIVNQASPQAIAQVAVGTSSTLNTEANSVTANVSSDAAESAAVTTTTATLASPQSTPLAASTVANSSDAKITRTDSTQAAAINAPNSTPSIGLTNVVSEKAAASSDTQVEAQAAQGQESAFNFDAKLAKSDAQQNPKALEIPASLAGVAKTNAQVQQASLTSKGAELGVQAAAAAGTQISTNANAIANANTNFTDDSNTLEIDSDARTFSNVQSGMKAGRTGETLPATANSPAAITAPANRMDSAALAAANPNSTVMPQEAPRAETTQSLEDISSSFVSSLVGGPQRPVTTVMDWISMQSQERPAPLVPHEVRLDAGAVQMEIQKMVKQGGGHVVMELTPPDQSKFTIELKLDERGNALLIVEGVSDSTKTRLEQSAPQLREQFQQMGLELQLDMRQQGQSASSNAANFADAQERSSGDNNLANNGAGEAPKILTQREAGANRARETGSNQVYLYA
jgi:hypothetical protein